MPAYKFDPSYGYTLEDLLAVQVSEEPTDFDAFWEARYRKALEVNPAPQLVYAENSPGSWQVCDLKYTSTDGVEIRGWCLLPKSEPVERILIFLHGYGGVDGPVADLPFKNAALFFPCLRGISLSKHPPISSEPLWHVLHDIQDKDRYVHGGCVEDVWLAVSSAQKLFPKAADRVGLLGISFGGGIGAMATAFDSRIGRAHFNVPSFGHQKLRLTLETTGSGAAVQAMHRRKPEVIESTLAYYDAAVSAKRIQVPTHFACALFDPMVAPPGQFAVYNAVPGQKSLFPLIAGHYDYPEQEDEERALLQELNEFFQPL
ncbi:MAG: acetylxylan esterase [Opitutaceae bacterium]